MAKDVKEYRRTHLGMQDRVSALKVEIQGLANEEKEDLYSLPPTPEIARHGARLRNTAYRDAVLALHQVSQCLSAVERIAENDARCHRA